MEIVGSSTIGRPDRWGHGTGAFHLLSLISTDLHVATYMPIVLMTQDFLHTTHSLTPAQTKLIVSCSFSHRIEPYLVVFSYGPFHIASGLKAKDSTWPQGKRKGRRLPPTKVDNPSAKTDVPGLDFTR